MLNYLIFLFIPPIILYFTSHKKNYENLGWFIVFFFLLALSTFRDNIGSDQGDYSWTYMRYYFDFDSSSFPNYEIFYSLIEFISSKILFLGFEGVNFFCAIFYLVGLILLIKDEKKNWLCLFISLPYFYFTISWGHLRQSLALGFVLFSVYFYKEKNYFPLLISLTLAFLSHKFSIIFIPVLIFSIFKNKYKKTALALGVGIIIGLVFYITIVNSAYLHQFITDIPKSYTTSKGGVLRSFMNLIPSILFLLNLKYMKKYYDYSLYFYISIICITMFPLSFFFPIPIARIGIYFGLIQFIVLPRIIDSFNYKNQLISICFVISYYLAVFIMWLLYSPHIYLWLPYKFTFFGTYMW